MSMSMSMSMPKGRNRHSQIYSSSNSPQRTIRSMKQIRSYQKLQERSSGIDASWTDFIIQQRNIFLHSLKYFPPADPPFEDEPILYSAFYEILCWDCYQPIQPLFSLLIASELVFFMVELSLRMTIEVLGSVFYGVGISEEGGPRENEGFPSFDRVGDRRILQYEGYLLSFCSLRFPSMTKICLFDIAMTWQKKKEEERPKKVPPYIPETLFRSNGSKIEEITSQSSSGISCYRYDDIFFLMHVYIFSSTA